jgi:hypothetical protein
VDHTNTRVHGIAWSRKGLLDSVQDDASFIWLIQAIEKIHQGGLAGTILTEKSMNLTRLHHKGNAVVGDNGTKALGDSLKFKLHCPVPFCGVKID